MVDLKLGRIRRAALMAASLLALAPALLLAQTVEIKYRWSSPGQGARVDHYNVYHIINGGAPILLAMEPDTTFTLDAAAGLQHQIQVSGVSSTGREGPLSEPSDPVSLELRPVSGTTPSAPGLRPNFPNPFNPETRIVYGLPKSVDSSTRVALDVYDVAGHRVRRLYAETTPGWHTVTWDGTDDRGVSQPSGQYIVRLACAGAVTSWKMMMLK